MLKTLVEGGGMIDGDWDPDIGECEFRFDETMIDDIADIVEFYRAHGPQVQGAAPHRTQQVAAALARRCDIIIDDMIEDYEEMEGARERQREEMDEDEASG